MQTTLLNDENVGIFTKKYWFDAAKQLKSTKMITVAALVVALRVSVKLIKISLAAGLSISLDAYVNSLGSAIYGPVVGLVVGAISDILGLIITGQMGEYFPPFTLVEMSSSFIFGLFFWRRKIKPVRVLAAKFSVNLICNIFMTSVFMKWMKFIQGGKAAADAYGIINGVRIGKNLVLFPLEATIIVVVLSSALPILAKMKLVGRKYCEIENLSYKKLAVEVALFTVLSVGLVLLYIFVLADLIKSFNINIW